MLRETYQIPPKYQFWGKEENGVICYIDNGFYGYMTVTGEILIPAKYPIDHNSYSLILRGGTAMLDAGGAINLEGEVIVPDGYAAYQILENGYVIVYTADVDSDMKRYYEEVEERSYIYNKIFSNIRWGLYDNKGRMLFEPQFTNSPTDELILLQLDLQLKTENGMLIAKTDDGMGMINMQGEFAIAPIYEDLSYFSEGFAVAKNKNGKYAHINEKDEKLYEQEWDNAFPFSEGYGAVSDASV